MPCAACAANGTDKVLYPITMTTTMAVGYCIDLGCTVNAVDFPFGTSPGSDQFLLRQGGPGWYVWNNKLKPCQAGSYCPFNATAGYYNLKPECSSSANQFCAAQMISPRDCSGFYDCQGGRIRAGPGGLVIFIVSILFLIGWCAWNYRRSYMMQRDSQRLAALYKDDDVKHSFGVEFQEASVGGTKTVVPAYIQFHDVGLTLNGAKEGEGIILQGVTGRFPPGSLVALMGPSGCGKTTFMNTMLGRTPYGTTSGSISINGDGDMPLLKKKGVAGFVPQDDIVHPSMTVFQNLYYHALLRLPASIAHEEKVKHVQHVVKVLGLEKVQDSIVGSPEARGISGGQKKRVNIGMELVAMPSFIFMDEPTSGLDGAATVSLAQCMGLLAKSGLTIVCVIHQPRWLVFQEFTHVLLLGEGGKTVFCGRSDLLVAYLTSLGFTRPEAENPADWMIDVCSGLMERRDGAGAVDGKFKCPEDLYARWEAHERPNSLAKGFRWTKGDPDPADHTLEPLVSRQSATLAQSVWFLTTRAFHMLDSKSIAIDCLIITLTALPAVLSAILSNADFSWTALLGGAAGTLKPSFYFLIVVALQHRADYGDNMLIISRELNSGISVFGMYAALAIRTWTLLMIKALLFCTVSYWFNTPVQNFGLYYLAFLLGAWCWTGFTNWVTIVIHKQMTAMLVIVIIALLETLYSGMLCMPPPAGKSTTFCPVNSLRSQAWLPPYFGGWAAVQNWQARTLWPNELQQYPLYTANISTVNMTNYYYKIASYDNLQSPDYVAASTGGFMGLLVLGLLHQLVTFSFLFSVQTWVRLAYKESNKRTAAVLRGWFSWRSQQFAEQTGQVLPHEEMARVTRMSERMSEGR